MKLVTFILTTVSLLPLAIAQPHGRRHDAHEHAHQLVKDDNVVTVYETHYAKPTGAPAPALGPGKQQASQPAGQTAQSSDETAGTPTDRDGYGFSYSPYKADHSCKSADEVLKDFDMLSDNKFALVRIYGTDCDQVATVLAAAKKHKMKLFAGIFNIDDVNGEAQKIISAAGDDWSQIETISVGNELVNSGVAASKVVAAIESARSILDAAKYTGNIVTVDTLVAARANPSICDASDFCAVNCHPFFDGNVAAENSGKFLEEQIPTLQAVLGDKNKKIVVTETGWPWQGAQNGAAIPSKQNQEAAISSIKDAFKTKKSSVVLFTAFNDYWKTSNDRQHGAEQFWGMFGDAPAG